MARIFPGVKGIESRRPAAAEWLCVPIMEAWHYLDRAVAFLTISVLYRIREEFFYN